MLPVQHGCAWTSASASDEGVQVRGSHMGWDGALCAVLRDQVDRCLLLVAEHCKLVPVLSLHRGNKFSFESGFAKPIMEPIHEAVCQQPRSVCLWRISDAHHTVAARGRGGQALGFAGCRGRSIRDEAQGPCAWPLLRLCR